MSVHQLLLQHYFLMRYVFVGCFCVSILNYVLILMVKLYASCVLHEFI